MRPTLLRYIFAVTLCALYFPLAVAQDFDSLKGLKSFAVLIEDIDDEGARAGLTRDQLKIDVEVRLRKAGLSVLPRIDIASNGATAYLYLNANLLKGGGEYYAYSLSLEMKQAAIILRAPEPGKKVPLPETVVTTWDRNMVGIVGTSNMRRVRENIGDLVDAFINDYLSVNPR